MSEIIDIAMGDLYVATAPATLTTSSIGSCLAVCLFSHTDRAGALAHVMLPERPQSETEITETDYKYADVAIAIMVKELEKMGIPRTRLIAKVSGGANMFPGVQGRSHKIGEKNIAAVQQLLASYSIRIAAEDTGGNSGRAVTFDLTNGLVTIKVTI
jgi:chemotaxis protein CheD